MPINPRNNPERYPAFYECKCCDTPISYADADLSDGLCDACLAEALAERRPDLVAHWDGLDSYRCYDFKPYPEGIESQDGGIEWHNGDGELCCGQDFMLLRIQLVGGPHSGAVVA